MGKRTFVSIQPVIQDKAVTLIAIADDGTAWSLRGYVSDHWESYSDEEQWVQIPGLPDKDPLTLPAMKL